MFPPKDHFLDQLKNTATGTLSAMESLARGARTQIMEDLRVRADEWATRLDLVPREDFERLEQRLAETRTLLDRQTQRLDALERALKDDTPVKALGPVTAKRL